MGRELKRVPVDFDWPIDEIWEGFKNPHWVDCPACEGQGDTKAAQRLDAIVGLIMLSGSDSLSGKTHPYFLQDVSPFYRTQKTPVSKDMAELGTALAGREPSFMGHDAMDRWRAGKKILETAGVDENWGVCKKCDGHGIPKDKFKTWDEWKHWEPPTGDGYQIWETVSEGSPISPVFATAHELAMHMKDTRWGADSGTSYERWMKFIEGPGWSMSMVMDDKGIRDGVQAVTD